MRARCPSPQARGGRARPVNASSRAQPCACARRAKASPWPENALQLPRGPPQAARDGQRRGPILAQPAQWLRHGERLAVRDADQRLRCCFGSWSSSGCPGPRAGSWATLVLGKSWSSWLNAVQYVILRPTLSCLHAPWQQANKRRVCSPPGPAGRSATQYSPNTSSFVEGLADRSAQLAGAARGLLPTARSRARQPHHKAVMSDAQLELRPMLLPSRNNMCWRTGSGLKERPA